MKGTIFRSYSGQREIMWLRSSSISLDEYGPKIRKISRCRFSVSNETIPVTRQEFFLTKITPVQSITDTALMVFWLMLLSWIFIPSYTAIYFFVKTFVFSNVYISDNTIFECLYLCFGWEREEGESRPMCTFTLTLSLFIFLAVFLSYGALFYLPKFNITFIQNKCVYHKWKISFCHHEISFFH